MDEVRVLPHRLHRARSLALILLSLVPLAFGALALWLGQDANWDLRNYHWYNAYALLNGRYGFDILPSQTPWFYNPALDVPFYLLATHVPARVAGFVLGTVQGLNFILLFMLAHATLIVPNARQKVIICAALAALGMLGGGGIALIGTTFGDNVSSLGLFASALLVIANLNRLMTKAMTEAFPLALLFGIPAGLMMGLKLPSVVFCTGLCFALLFVGGSFQRRFMLSFAFGLGVLAGTAIALGPWAWFLETHFGSPLFPYFNNVFKSPLAPPTSARDTEYVTRSLHDFFLFPFVFGASAYRTGEIDWRDWRVPILYALLPLAILLRLIFGRTKQKPDALAQPSPARYLLWAAAISYFAWLIMFCIYRYLIPLEMLAPLLIVVVIGMLPLKLQTRGILAGFILLVIAASIQPGNWHRRASWTDHFVETSVPDLGDTSDLMILMAGIEPYSHVIPAFPPEIPFVRIESNFAKPGDGKGINAVLQARIEAHKGRFMLLIPPWQVKTSAGVLAAYHLALGSKPCQTVVDHLYDDKTLDLCQLVRTNP